MIKQTQEAYTWAAIYRDDSYIGEYDRPEGRGFAEVNSTQVKQLKLESSNPALHSHYVEVPTGAAPIFFRRRSIELFLLDGQSDTRPTVHCIGWKRGETGTYLFVFNNGSTLLTDNLQAV